MGRSIEKPSVTLDESDEKIVETAREIVALHLRKSNGEPIVLATDVSDAMMLEAYQDGGFMEWPLAHARIVTRALGAVGISHP